MVQGTYFNFRHNELAAMLGGEMKFKPLRLMERLPQVRKSRHNKVGRRYFDYVSQ
jgi:hypothetical protein